MHVERNADGHALCITMLKPSDMHHHFRRGELLKLVAPMVSKRFAMAIAMPNTQPPITTARMATEYADEIGRGVGPEKFYPLMTLYLTDTLDPKEVEQALNIVGVKYYPRGLTTNSDSGVENPASLWTKGTRPYEVLRTLAECGLTLLLHAADGFDRSGRELDPYDQEKHFIAETLPRIIHAHPDLRISVEHLSTKEGADYIEHHAPDRNSSKMMLGCSVTQHHLLLDRRDSHRGGFRPHTFWWPIIGREQHRDALRELVRKDYAFVWLGSDSAPHPVGKKETDCCSGGVLTAHAGIEFYAEIFDQMGALDDRFERFASINGPRFYGLRPCDETITLVRKEWTHDENFVFVEDGKTVEIRPFRRGEKIQWKLVD
jgi:dihydroorotase